MGATDYYLILGISRAESPQGVRDAFRRLAFRYHPDRAASSSTRQFQDILEAFHVLADPSARQAYDRRLPLAVEPLSLFGDFYPGVPSAEEVFDRLLRNFTRRHVPKAERLAPLDLDLIVSPEEARLGDSVSLSVPVFHSCESCSGSGRQSLFPCVECKETGIIEGQQLVQIQLPPMVRPGTVFEIPLRGVDNLYLRVRILIGG